ncbi:hypothetical protein LMH87_002732 [Akanthomyces muscarius]|uniref:SAC3/GANP/THP3 conserved domain-containing protein n=1 Tax=Akanthomyces muscarius TaxID=2231603 RepID=A0A9W8UJY5_AKAMU|nr:hypothetical protein LMH87_002732 [Akanthomyces muscarius]KAJ4148253.1 hypothetical protein LMH87_002732 [Akanthomyces muscarius]
MFSPFGTSTQSSTPAASNPFAPKTNPFGQDGSGTSAFGAKPKSSNPFAQNTASSSSVNGASNPFASTPLATAANEGKQTSKPAWGQQTNGSQPSSSPYGGKPEVFTKPQAKLTSTPAPAFSSAPKGNGELPSSNDPHARRIYEQLRQDGIAPPAWPSQPGDPQHKAQMAKFREQYEDYRSKVRASLTRAGLIDDPTKRKALREAIDFKGICEDMCPEYEKITRITELDIPTPEKDPQTTFASTTRMVKKLARSAAGQEAPLPMDVLSVPTLRKTLDYLVDDLLRNDENLPTLHGYLWDRTRAIRRDFTFFSTLGVEEMKIQASVLEDIARFHVTALHLLSQSGKAPEDFVEQQELEQLSKALLTLRDIYDDCYAQGSPCENEAEFRAYYVVFHANDPNVLEMVQRQWRPSLYGDCDVIRTAVSLVEALQNTSDFHGPLLGGPSLAAGGAHQTYFRIVQDKTVSYTMACFAECHFPQLRRSILGSIKRALARPREPSRDVTAAALNKYLQFDTVQQAIEFAELHDVEFQPSQQNPADRNLSCAVLYNSSTLPHPRLQHQFSQALVEDKRGSRSLPEVVHKTVYADAATAAHKEASLAQEGSLFVQDEPAKPPSIMPPPPLHNPFGGFGQPTTNGGALSNPLTQAPAAAGQAKSNFFSQEIKPASTAQRPTPPFGIQNPSTAAPTPSFGVTAQNSPFAKALPLQTSSSEPATKETHPFGDGQTAPAAKTSFGLIGSNAGTSEPPTTISSTTPSASLPAVSGFKPKAAEPPTGASSSSTPHNAFSTPAAPAFGGFNFGAQKAPTATSDTIQKALPAFSGFSAQPQSTEAAESAKSLTPPGSPALTQPAFTKPPTESNVPVPTSKSNSVLHSFSPPSKPPAFLGSAVPPTVASPATAPPVELPKLPQPKRDRLLDFTKWIVVGDAGLMAEFQQFWLNELLAPVFLDWHQKEEEKRRHEEETRDNAIADNFRKRSLSVRYFYRWKTHAREKRLKFLRRSGRDQLRNFHRARQMASSIPQAIPKSRPEVPPIPKAHREQALMEGFRKSQVKQARKRSIPPPNRSSTMDVSKARDSAAAIGRHFNLSMPQSGTSSPTRSRSSSMSRGGSKTRALREELLGDSTGHFRRSLPSIASSEESRPESVRSSKVSERWRLKAMGIVQLPDGTAVPESLMNDRRFNRSSQRASSITSVPSRRPSITSMTSRRPSFTSLASRRPSIGSIPPLPAFLGTNDGAIPSAAVLEDHVGNKRKRVSEASTGSMEVDDGPPSNNHKRVMSDVSTRDLVNELRALREEMEEGTLWFRSQNERLHAEISSRDGTPLDDSMSVASGSIV